MYGGSSRLRIVGFLLSAVIVIDAHPCVAQSSDDPARFVRWAAGDIQALAVTASPFVPALVVGSTAIVRSSSSLDRRVSEATHSAMGVDLPLPLEASNQLGGPKATILAAAAFGGTLLTRDTKLQDAAFTSLQSLLLAGGMSYSIKYALGRHRPYHGNDPNLYDSFSGNTSFPSGHATAAFAIVTPWVYYYPSPYTYALLGVAGGTAVARVAKEHHWPTDVAAGAALGFLTGRFLANRHLNAGTGLTIEPMALGSGAELRIAYRF